MFLLSITGKKKKKNKQTPLLPIFNSHWGQNRSKLLTTFRHCKPNAYHRSVLPTIDTYGKLKPTLTFSILMPPFLGVLTFNIYITVKFIFFVVITVELVLKLCSLF